MTLMIILGGFAACYLILLIFRLAAIALPLYAGIAGGLWMVEHGTGYAAAILAGVSLGFAIYLVGRFLCAYLPPFYRLPVALLFAVPGGFAGYQAAKGIGGLALPDGLALEGLAWVAALTAAVTAWLSIAGGHPQRPGGLPLEPAS